MYFVNCFLSPSRFPTFATVLSFVFDFEFEYSLHSPLFYTSRDASFYIPVRLSMITGNSMFIKNNASTNSVLFLLIFIYIYFILGLSVYRTEKKRRRRHRRRTNLLIEAMRMCRNFRHYPRNRIPERCRDMIFRQDDRRRGHNGPTIVIIEK